MTHVKSKDGKKSRNGGGGLGGLLVLGGAIAGAAILGALRRRNCHKTNSETSGDTSKVQGQGLRSFSETSPTSVEKQQSQDHNSVGGREQDVGVFPTIETKLLERECSMVIDEEVNSPSYQNGTILSREPEEKTKILQSDVCNFNDNITLKAPQVLSLKKVDFDELELNGEECSVAPPIQVTLTTETAEIAGNIEGLLEENNLVLENTSIQDKQEGGEKEAVQDGERERGDETIESFVELNVEDCNKRDVPCYQNQTILTEESEEKTKNLESNVSNFNEDIILPLTEVHCDVISHAAVSALEHNGEVCIVALPIQDTLSAEILEGPAYSEVPLVKNNQVVEHPTIEGKEEEEKDGGGEEQREGEAAQDGERERHDEIKESCEELNVEDGNQRDGERAKPYSVEFIAEKEREEFSCRREDSSMETKAKENKQAQTSEEGDDYLMELKLKEVNSLYGMEDYSVKPETEEDVLTEYSFKPKTEAEKGAEGLYETEGSTILATGEAVWSSDLMQLNECKVSNEICDETTTIKEPENHVEQESEHVTGKEQQEVANAQGGETKALGAKRIIRNRQDVAYGLLGKEEFGFLALMMQIIKRTSVALSVVVGLLLVLLCHFLAFLFFFFEIAIFLLFAILS